MVLGDVRPPISYWTSPVAQVWALAQESYVGLALALVPASVSIWLATRAVRLIRRQWFS